MQLPTNEVAPSPRGAKAVDKKQKYGWSTVDEPGVPYLAAKTDLHIDSTYQRTVISESRVMQIVQSWSWVACGSLIVAERDGKLWVIDGQHRAVAAMRRSDIQELPCLVFKSSGADEEAQAFYRANCVRGNVSAFDKLRAQLASGDQLAIDAVHLMESMGYKPTGIEERFGVRCVAGFISAMKADRGMLKRVWPLIAKLHDGLPLRSKVFSAILYLGKFGTDDIAAPMWTERVLKHGLNAISDAIDRASSLYAKGGAKTNARATLDVINKGVRHTSRMDIMENVPDDDA